MSYSMLYKSPVQNLELISDGESLTHVLYKYNDTTVTHPTNPDLDIFKKDNISQEIVRKLIFHLNRKALIFKKVCGESYKK